MRAAVCSQAVVLGNSVAGSCNQWVVAENLVVDYSNPCVFVGTFVDFSSDRWVVAGNLGGGLLGPSLLHDFNDVSSVSNLLILSRY